jgi:hypothetical protein
VDKPLIQKNSGSEAVTICIASASEDNGLARPLPTLRWIRSWEAVEHSGASHLRSRVVWAQPLYWLGHSAKIGSMESAASAARLTPEIMGSFLGGAKNSACRAFPIAAMNIAVNDLSEHDPIAALLIQLATPAGLERCREVEPPSRPPTTRTVRRDISNPGRETSFLRLQRAVLRREACLSHRPSTPSRRRLGPIDIQDSNCGTWLIHLLRIHLIWGDWNGQAI